MYTYLGVEFLGHVITLNISEIVKNLPDPGVEPGSPALQADCLLSEQPGKPNILRSCKTSKASALFSTAALAPKRSVHIVWGPD